MKKVLSALLAIVLVITSLSIVAYGKADYKDGAIDYFDSLDQPVFDTEQYASMALDYVDSMLLDANINVEFDLAGILNLKLDLRSIDSALDSVQDLVGTLKTVLGGSFGPAFGDLRDLMFNQIDPDEVGTLSRLNSRGADIDIVLALLGFIADNLWLVGDLLGGTLNLGSLGPLLKSFGVDLNELINIEKMLKELLAKLLYPQYFEEGNSAYVQDYDVTAKTLDEYLEDFINELLNGTYVSDSDTFAAITNFITTNFPGLAGEIDLINDSVYDIIEKAIRLALSNGFVIDTLINDMLKKWVWDICGRVYTDDGEGGYIFDDSGLNENADFVNVDFEITADTFDVEHWGAVGTDSFVNHLNEILGNIFGEVAKFPVDWSDSNGNDDLLANVIGVLKTLLGLTGGRFFADYVEVKTAGEIEEMEDAEFMAYLLRAILNSAVYDVNVPEDKDSIAEVVFYTVRAVAAKIVPSQNYTATSDDTDDLIEDTLNILTDMLISVLGQIFPVGDILYYGMGLEEFCDAMVGWVELTYGGFISSFPSGTGFEKLSSIVFGIIPANWLSLDGESGMERTNLYDIIRNDIIGKLFNLDLSGILLLLERNPDSGNHPGELNSPIITVLLARIRGILNFIFDVPGNPTCPADPYFTYDNLEMLLDPLFLSGLVEGLLLNLYLRSLSGGLLDALLPVLCMIMGLTEGQYFGYPDFNIPNTFKYVADNTSNTFTMYNGSGGVNTAWTSTSGVQTRDDLYSYRIVSATANLPGVTVVWDQTNVPGGTATTFTIKGLTNTFTHNLKALRITVEYDLYTQTGAKMTNQTLKAECYTFLAHESITEDLAKAEKIGNSGMSANCYYITATKGIFVNQKEDLSKIANYEVTLSRSSSDTSTYSSHTAPSSAFAFQSGSPSFTSTTYGTLQGKVLANSIGPETSPNTIWTTNAGSSIKFNPFKIVQGAERPDDGEYQIVTNYLAGATIPSGGTKTITYPIAVFIYDDHDLPDLLSNALRANRQQSSYEMGGYDATFNDPWSEDGEEMTQYVTGSWVWDQYVAAVEQAVSIVYHPKRSAFWSDCAEKYELAAMELKMYTQMLECGAKTATGGATAVATALAQYYQPSEQDGNGNDVPYYHPGRKYFTDEDYVTYTYNNFMAEKSGAESLINKALKGEVIDSIEAQYTAHRVNLYGTRLLRLRAYKEHLQEEYNLALPITQDHYSQSSWDNFVIARDFAASVLAEGLGNITNVLYLEGDGLRQSKVNKAYSELVNARKKLKSSVDYAQLQGLIDLYAETYLNDEALYTSASWYDFQTAYEAGLDIIAENLKYSVDNQNRVNTCYNDLLAAFTYLVLEGGELNPRIEAVENAIGNEFTEELLSVQFLYTDVYGSYGDGLEPNSFLYGLDYHFPLINDDVIEAKDEARYELDYEYNDYGEASTGTRVKVYDNEDNLVKTYWVAYMGDLNGDGSADFGDVEDMIAAANGANAWSVEGDRELNPWFFAADVNHDYSVDYGDLTELINVAAFGVGLFKQHTLEEYDTFWAF